MNGAGGSRRSAGQGARPRPGATGRARAGRRRSLKDAYTEGARARFLGAGVALARAGVTADLLTIVGLLLHVVALPLIVTGHFILAALVFAVAAVCDALDGAVARAGVGATKAGAFLDSTTDRISELLVSGALVVFMARAGRWWEMIAVLLFMGASQLVSYTRARAEALGVDCRVGLMSRPERVVVLVAGFVLSGLHVGGVSLLTITIYLLAVLTSLTVAHRMAHVMRKLRAGASA